MAYKVAIDANAGGSISGNSGNGIVEKDYTLLISRYINNRLNELGIDSFLVRDDDSTLTTDERVNLINNKYGNGNDIIVLSNRLNKGGNSGVEIIYALRNNSKLASLIASNLEDVDANVEKYYQQRNSIDTALDDDLLIRNTKNNQTIIVNYGYVDNTSDANKIKNEYESLAEAVVKTISTYAGVSYYPNNLDGYYIVKKGDSLWSIASKNNTTVDKIKKLNNLSSNNLQIGQILKIRPTSEEDAVDNKTTYIVKKGDSLWSIASKNNTTVDNIKKLNNLSSNNLQIGQKLIISDANDNLPSNKITYIVKKGDSLWIIANKYDTTVDKIKSENNLTSNSLSIGQKLVIPSTSNYVTYTVKKGDSLWIIAKNYNTTVDKIKKLNNLSSNSLSIGQKLIIDA